MLWARNYCYKNLWRVESSLGELDDAEAECAMLFVECRKRYGASVNHPAHFMRLYQLMVITRFHDLSTKDSKYRHIESNYAPFVTTVNDGALRVKLGGSSKELQAVMNVLLYAPGDVLQVIMKDTLLPPKYIMRRLATFCGISNPKVVAEALTQELHNLLT